MYIVIHNCTLQSFIWVLVVCRNVFRKIWSSGISNNTLQTDAYWSYKSLLLYTIAKIYRVIRIMQWLALYWDQIGNHICKCCLCKLWTLIFCRIFFESELLVVSSTTPYFKALRSSVILHLSCILLAISFHFISHPIYFIQGDHFSQCLGSVYRNQPLNGKYIIYVLSNSRDFYELSFIPSPWAYLYLHGYAPVPTPMNYSWLHWCCVSAEKLKDTSTDIFASSLALPVLNIWKHSRFLKLGALPEEFVRVPRKMELQHIFCIYSSW